MDNFKTEDSGRLFSLCGNFIGTVVSEKHMTFRFTDKPEENEVELKIRKYW